MIDSHCHFDFAPFADAPDAYLLAANQAGVGKLIVPSVGYQNWPAVMALGERFPKALYFALGVHPLWANSHDLSSIAQLKVLLANEHPRCVAIGECGLDFASADCDKDKQRQLLEAQLQLAIEFDLPVILHCRKAHNELLALLNRYSRVRGVLHAFSGSEQQGREYIKRGFCLGIGGTISYLRANKTRQAVSKLPLASLLLETDAPDMPLFGMQDTANLPQNLKLIANELAKLKGCDVELVCQQTRLNTQQLFQLVLD